MREHHFLNLTNGLEWLPDLPAPVQFVRVESTAIEKGDWDRVLRDLDANLLLPLACGDVCHLYDCGAGRPISKTVSVGVPFIRDALSALWYGDPVAFEARTLARQAMKRKLLYFRRYATGGSVRFVGHSRATFRDGNRSHYRQLLREAGYGLHEFLPLVAELSR